MRGSRPRPKTGSRLTPPAPRLPPALPLDAAVVPALLLLIARDLLVHDPPRVLAWRLMHQEAGRAPALLAPLLRLPPAWDRDPIALLLGALAAALALAYMVAVLRGARPAVRGALIGIAATVLVLIPTLAFVALGAATGRPYGQDGGVVQLPLTLDRILAGRSPYGGDYSDSILGKEARVSDFWAPYGGNPILHHHAYLPGTHLVMMPFYLATRAAGLPFDPRVVTLLAYVLAALLASRLPADPPARLAAAAAVAVNPLVYWQQIFGANDLIVAALLLLAVRLGSRRALLASAVVGLACATKQLAWPFAPFLLVSLAGIRAVRDLASAEARLRLGRLVLVSLAVWTAVVGPVALLDLRAFWGDIVVYNLGLRGGDAYPFGGTPGFGFANLLIYGGRVSSLRDHVSLGWSWLILAPVGLLLLRRQMRDSATEATALLTGSAMLLASLYFSRVVHANYLILAATLLPVAALASRRIPADVAVVPLLLLALAVETVENGLFRATWAQAVESGLTGRLGGIARALAPRAGPGLTDDPLGLLAAAVAAGLGILYLLAAVFGASLRLRVTVILVAVIGVVALPTLAVIGIGRATGLVRSQDRWTARLALDDRLLHGAPVPPVAEAWSTSFQQDPPARMEIVPPMSPGTAAVAWLLRVLKSDPRALSLIAALALALVAPRLVAPEQRPIVLGVALLSPAAAVGTIFGSGDLVVLAAMLAAVLLSRSSRALAAGAVTGVATAIVPRALLAAPFLLLPVSAQPAVISLIVGLALGWGMVVVPLLASGPSTLAVSLLPTARLEPGIGLANLLLDLGHAGATAAMGLGILTAVLAAVGAIAALRSRAEFPRLYALAGTLLLAGLFTAPGASPHDLAAPMVLLLLGVVAHAHR